jgi:hypothetical protein
MAARIKQVEWKQKNVIAAEFVEAKGQWGQNAMKAAAAAARGAVRAADAVWWLVAGAQIVRQIGPDEPPEVIDRAERAGREQWPGPGGFL